MSSRDGERYYWLKLHKDFFKRHDICLLEAGPGGREAVLLYVKLMVEAIDHDGALRFSAELPYTEEMIAVLTRTEEEVVRNALQELKRYGLMKVLEDGTLFLPAVAKLTGSETYQTKRKREAREERPFISGGVNLTPEIEIDIEKEKETDTETDTDIEINDYCAEMKLISAPEAIPLVDKTVFAASEEEIEAWQKAFPAADVKQELQEMRAWWT